MDRQHKKSSAKKQEKEQSREEKLKRQVPQQQDDDDEDDHTVLPSYSNQFQSEQERGYFDKESGYVDQENLIDEEVIIHDHSIPHNAAGAKNDYHTRQRLIVILEAATLEIAQTKKGIELLNCDDHEKLIVQKMKRSLEDFRPDIAHQVSTNLKLIHYSACQLQWTLLLTKLGNSRSANNLNSYSLIIYMKTSKGILIEINPSIRIPRTFKRFSGLMAQLLTKQRIVAPQGVTGNNKSLIIITNENFLMKVIRPPIAQYLPKGAKVIGTSLKAQKLVNLYEFKLQQLNEFVKEDLDVKEKPVVFVVGCTSVGNPTLDLDYLDDTVSVSHYALSAQCVCSKLCNTFTDYWNIM